MLTTIETHVDHGQFIIFDWSILLEKINIRMTTNSKMFHFIE